MADAISKILPNKNLLESMANSAYIFATQQRTWSQTIEKTISLYEGIL
jgi:glycosyltransferase involved in cell wall biosynthesis